MKIKLLLFLGLIFFSVFLFPRNAFAQSLGQLASEQILSYDSGIIINTDSTLDVTETITVNALGQSIKRGIYRDFPTIYETDSGGRYVTGFEILEITRDGKTEPYHTENLSNGTRIYIGESSVYLNPGIYTYQIRYKTDRQIGFFEDRDELFYNAIGTGWVFPIKNSQVEVILPQGVSVPNINYLAYTGPQGSENQNYTARSITEHGKAKVIYTLTQDLSPYEGFTIAVTWPKGYVTPPTSLQNFRYLLRDNLSLIINFLSLLIVGTYYFLAWIINGKDPKVSNIVLTEFEPPKDISPAMARFIHKMSFDTKCVSALLVGLAIKKKIKLINEKKKSYAIKLLNSDTKGLSEEELKIIHKAFFKSQ